MTAADLAAWLLTYAVHSTALLAVAWLLTRYHIVHTPHALDLLWKTALIGGIATAALQLGIGVRPWGGQLALGRAEAAAASARIPVIAHASELPSRVAATESHAVPRGLAASAAPPSPVSGPARPPIHFDATTLLLALWAAAAATLLAQLLLARLLLARRLGRREAVTEPDLLALLDSLRAEMAMPRPVRITRAAGLSSPIALGGGEICLPDAALTELDVSQQRSVLAHELAHLARRDPRWLALACTLERVFFFQPLNRTARRQMQEAAEYICDDWAARRAGSGLAVARSLVKVAEWLQAPAAVPLAGMAESRSQLLARVQRLIESRPMTDEPRRRWLPFLLLPPALLVAAAVVPGVTSAQRAVPPQQPARPAGPPHAPATAPVAPPAAPLPPAAAPSAPSAPETAGPAEAAGAALAGMDTNGVLVMDAGRINAQVRRAMRAAAAVQVRPRIAAAMARATHQLRAMRMTLDGGETPMTPQDSARRAAAVDALIDALRDQNADVREAAARSLGQLEDHRATQGLIAAMSDKVPDVRRAAAEALSQLEDKRSTDAFITALRDSDVEMRRIAVNALGQLEDPKAAPALAAALKDGDSEVRASAASAVAELQDPRAVPALRELLNDKDADVRENAVNALSEIRDSTALEALIGALKSSDPVVRRAAADALGQRD
jgi:beta-lactamase regulating signal transducer with metallopeptidase domain